MLEIARHREVAHFVYASSSSVYGGNESLPFRVEDRVDHPLSLYAATKKADELMSETYAHLYRLPQTGLRFFTVYGPWGRPEWRCGCSPRRSSPAADPGVRRGNMRRDFTYVDESSPGWSPARQSSARRRTGKSRAAARPHRLYNIGNSRSEELKRMIGVIEQACGRKAERGYCRCSRATCAIRSPISARSSATLASARDNDREGIPRFVDWYRDYHGCKHPGADYS